MSVLMVWTMTFGGCRLKTTCMGRTYSPTIRSKYEDMKDMDWKLLDHKAMIVIHIYFPIMKYVHFTQ